MKNVNVDADKLFEALGRNVKYYRKVYNIRKDKMTQENLAEAVDVCTALIGNLESENIKQGVSVPTLVRLSKALEVSIDDLLSPTHPDDF